MRRVIPLAALSKRSFFNGANCSCILTEEEWKCEKEGEDLERRGI
jgi:hypothetical protein